MQTLDEVVANYPSFYDTDFIKLDVQGYELEVLKGAQRTLNTTELVLMEVSFMQINEGAPLVHDVINFMHERDFQAYDVCSFIRRPLDRALWQSDFIFVRKDSRLLSRSSFN
jgi:hypothetical protein